MYRNLKFKNLFKHGVYNRLQVNTSNDLTGNSKPEKTVIIVIFISQLRSTPFG